MNEQRPWWERHPALTVLLAGVTGLLLTATVFVLHVASSGGASGGGHPVSSDAAYFGLIAAAIAAGTTIAVRYQRRRDRR